MIQIPDKYRSHTLRRRIVDACASAHTQVSSRRAALQLLSAFFRREEGSALVEIALILPALLALITAMCTFGVAFSNELTLTNAVGAGAQYLQLIRTSTSDPCADTLSAIEGAAPSLSGSSLSLSFSLNGTTVNGNSCPGDQSYLVQGEPITVSATYPCALAIYGTTFSKACQLSARVSEYEY